MKVSVIIPTYKPGDYLWECLNSLNSQDMPVGYFEVLLILNGCNEPYYTAIRSWMKAHCCDNFQIIQTDEPGVSNARNIGIEKAIGDYICFIDDDDFVSPSYIEELYACASKDVISLCYPLSFKDGTEDYLPYYITDNYIKGNGTDTYPYEKARRYFSGPVYKLIHKDIIGNRRFDISFKNGEDSIFMFAISDKFNKVRFTSQNAVYYRRVREGSALLRKKNKSEILGNCFNMMRAYTGIYLGNPMRYNLGFYITRILGAVHGAIEQIQLNRRFL